MAQAVGGAPRSRPWSQPSPASGKGTKAPGWAGWGEEPGEEGQAAPGLVPSWRATGGSALRGLGQV